MLDIAIVEDRKDAVQTLTDHIARLKKEKGIECKVTVFENGLFFIENYKPIYDAVFMDIEMPLMNGMEAAKKMREVDPYVPLVFITDLKQYALKGYEVEAMDFLVKPVNYTSFATMMERVKRRSTKKEEQLTISTAQGTFNVNINDIYYVEMQSHYVVYHTAHGEVRFFGSLSDEEKRLPGDRFVRCNSGFIVNLAHVKKIQDGDVYVAETGLPISRNKKTAFMQSLLRFMSERR